MFEQSYYICKNNFDMTKKKDLEHLHVRIKHTTAGHLKEWSEELGYSIGEVIDFLVDNFVKESNKMDQELERADFSYILSNLMEKIDKIGKKVGVEE